LRSKTVFFPQIVNGGAVRNKKGGGKSMALRRKNPKGSIERPIEESMPHTVGEAAGVPGQGARGVVAAVSPAVV
jgi:hypothetical protein